MAAGGEDCASYEGATPGEYDKSLPTQTAWAILGLMAVGRRETPAVKRGISYLVAQQNGQGEWEEQPYNAVGFPQGVFICVTTGTSSSSRSWHFRVSVISV